MQQRTGEDVIPAKAHKVGDKVLRLYVRINGSGKAEEGRIVTRVVAGAKGAKQCVLGAKRLIDTDRIRRVHQGEEDSDELFRSAELVASQRTQRYFACPC
jgi:hypothetical protein